jgi:hypothetical protein
MSFTLSDEHVEAFHRDGYTIFRGLVPPVLITELRTLAEEARVIAHERNGPQAQRLQPVQEFLDIGPYWELLELPELVEAVQRIVGEGCMVHKLIRPKSPGNPDNSQVANSGCTKHQPFPL